MHSSVGTDVLEKTQTLLGHLLGHLESFLSHRMDKNTNTPSHLLAVEEAVGHLLV